MGRRIGLGLALGGVDEDLGVDLALGGVGLEMDLTATATDCGADLSTVGFG
jgi:hypothetical protein